MNRVKRILLILVLAGSSGLFAQGSGGQVIDEVIAVVGNTPILRSELDVRISELDPEMVVTDEVKCDLLQQILIEKMLVHQAEIDSLPISDEEVNDQIDNLIRLYERQLKSKANIEKYLGMTVEEYKKSIFASRKAHILLVKMKDKIEADVKITPKEVRDFYQSIPVDSLPYISSEVEVAQIVIKPLYSVEAKEIALEQIVSLRERIINSGESFSRLAGLYSDDPGSRMQGGMLPEFGRGDMLPEFERAAFKLKQDSISDVIETKFGYHIIKLIDKRGEKLIVRHILIRPKLIDTDMEQAKAKMDTLLMKLRGNKISFCDAVKKYSEDEETKPNCGFFIDPNIGSQRISYDYLDKSMSVVISSLKAGEFSEPQVGYSPDGTPYYYIIYLKVETKPHVANLEQDWQRIQVMALSDKKEKELDKWAEKKRKETYIYISSYYLYCGYFDEWLTASKK